jgi:hypothetical protein
MSKLKLKCYYDGSDYVIAYSEEDASLIWEKFHGPGTIHESRIDKEFKWERIPNSKRLKINFDEHQPYNKKQTISIWIKEIGRAWLCSENI